MEPAWAILLSFAVSWLCLHLHVFITHHQPLPPLPKGRKTQTPKTAFHIPSGKSKTLGDPGGSDWTGQGQQSAAANEDPPLWI